MNFQYLFLFRSIVYHYNSVRRMRKYSNTDLRSENPLQQSRHDKLQYSSAKPFPFDYSNISNDKSSKRNMEYQPLSTTNKLNKPNMAPQNQTPSELPHKDRKRNADENKYLTWTPNSFKISSPKSSTMQTGNNTQRENRGNKVTPFTEHLALPPRPEGFQKIGTASRQKHQKVGSVYRKNLQFVKERSKEKEMSRENQQRQKREHLPPLSEPPSKKDSKYFEYVLKYSYRSKKGFLPNTTKTNQDAYIISTSIGKKSWQHYFGVCDGHGALGHHVSSFIKTNLPKQVNSNLDGVDKSYIREGLCKAFKATNDKLVNESGIDLNYSGSAVVGCYLNHNKLYCCNVGDSRAIIGYRRNEEKSKEWGVKQLSIDHKPSQKTEADRILKKGKGRIEQCKNHNGEHVGPLRVWLKEQNSPGLAMTRSFGDLVAASVGVSWEPEITQFTLSKEDKIIVIASDGVWEFLENQDIVDKLAPFYEKNEIEQACDFLLDYAHSKWKEESPIVDDISFVMIFMGYTT